MYTKEEQLQELTRINILDLLTSLGLENMRRGRKVVETIFRPPARVFARQIMQYDRLVGEQGLAQASREALHSFIHSLEIIGQEHIPATGPVLILSNHPGMSDTLALFSGIPRADLRVVAAARPFLQTLPNTSSKLIYVPDDAAQRMGVVRSVVNHLREGGAILTFPAGEIEPDPSVMPGASQSLEKWSESISIFLRLVPETKVIVVIVSGVIWGATLRNPIIRLRRKQKDRERMAAALQLTLITLIPSLRPNRVRVEFGEPMNTFDPSVRNDPAALKRLIAEQARLLINRLSRQGEKVAAPTSNEMPVASPAGSAGLPIPVEEPGKG